MWQFFLFFVAVLAVAIAETRGRTSPLHRLKSESTRLSKKKIAENAASRPNFGDFFGRRAPPPAARRRPRVLEEYLGVLEGEEPLVAAVQELVLEIVVMGRGEVVVMVLVVVRAGDGAASAVSVDHERATYRARARGRVRCPRQEAAAHAPAAACRRRFPGARGARER